MIWNWDAEKDKANKRKHGLSFALAQLVVEDPLAFTPVDDFENEERWQTVGRIGGATVFVVHTVSVSRADEGRIISARKATAHERKAYEYDTF